MKIVLKAGLILQSMIKTYFSGLDQQVNHRRVLVMAVLCVASFSAYLYFVSNSTLEWKGAGTMAISNPTNNKIIDWSNERIKPDSYRIVFTGARGRSPLAMMRQSCAVESAARHNPDRQIQLYISEDDQDEIGQPLSLSTDPWLAVVDQLDNVVIVLYNETEYFSGTPMESWYKEGAWRASPFKHAHYSDYMRFLTVYRGGGLYMDLDFITLKRLDERMFWNFVAVEDDAHSTLCNAIFHFEAGHRLLEPMMPYFLSIKYNPNDYTAHGPAFLTRFFSSHCGLRMEDLVSSKCLGVRILSRHYFYPIVWQQWERYFKEADGQTMDDVSRSYGVHVWNKISRDTAVNLDSNQLYAHLARTHCPLTVSANMKDSRATNSDEH